MPVEKIISLATKADVQLGHDERSYVTFAILVYLFAIERKHGLEYQRIEHRICQIWFKRMFTFIYLTEEKEGR